MSPFSHPFLSSADSPEIFSILLILPRTGYIHPLSDRGREGVRPYVRASEFQAPVEFLEVDYDCFLMHYKSRANHESSLPMSKEL